MINQPFLGNFIYFYLDSLIFIGIQGLGRTWKEKKKKIQRKDLCSSSMGANLPYLLAGSLARTN
jgi:hypothetical protein